MRCEALALSDCHDSQCTLKSTIPLPQSPLNSSISIAFTPRDANNHHFTLNIYECDELVMPGRCREPLDTPRTVNPCKQHSRHAVGHKADAQASQQTRVIFTASRYTATSKTREIGRNRSTQNHNNSFIRACHSQTKRPSRFMLSAMEHCRNTKVFITCFNPMAMTGIRFTHITGTYKKNNAGRRRPAVIPRA